MAAVFVDQKVEFSETVSHVQSCWHPLDPLCALASINHTGETQINFVSELGKATERGTVRRSACSCTCLLWNPCNRHVAVGWSDGHVSIIDHDSDYDGAALANGPNNAVTSLCWSSNGLKLLVGDATGELFIQKLDSHGRVVTNQPPVHHSLQSPIISVLLKPAIRDPFVVNALNGGGGTPSPEPDDALARMINQKTALEHSSTLPRKSFGESAIFYIGCENGFVYCIRENGIKSECFQADSSIMRLEYYQLKNRLLTLTTDLYMFQHDVFPDRLQEASKAKLSGKLMNFKSLWIPSGILVMSSGESQLRMWDMNNDENCVVQLQQTKGYSAADHIQCMAYCSNSRILAAATVTSRICLWKRSYDPRTAQQLDQQWKLQAPIQVALLTQCATELTWCVNSSALAILAGNDMFIIREQLMKTHFNEQWALVQCSQQVLSLCDIRKGTVSELKIDQSVVTGCFVAEKAIAIWNDAKMSLFELPDENAKAINVGVFSSNTQMAAVHGQNVFIVESHQIVVKTFQGTLKQTLQIAESEGEVSCMDRVNDFLVVGTTGSYVRVYDLTRREVRQHYNAKLLRTGALSDIGAIHSVALNCNGTRISCTVKRMDHPRNTDWRLIVWEAETDAIGYFNFELGINDQLEQDDQSQGQDEVKRRPMQDLLQRRMPGHHCWDLSDARLLVCEAARPEHASAYAPETVIASFFVTPDSGVIVHDTFVKSPHSDRLLGLAVPYVYLTKKSDASEQDALGNSNETSFTNQIIRRTIREFIGLSEIDQNTKDAMLNFSFYLAMENIDEAFKAIKLIRSESVWENMAHMCVKNERLDVAAVCLGNMGHARGARALRRSIARNRQHQVNVAVFAVHLGMIDDALALLLACDRFDLINRIHQTTNSWKTAFDKAQKEDRIHQRNTHFAYAGHLESIGAIDAAIEHYEKSDTHRFEVPRMLFDDPSVLEQYVKRKKDPYLKKWWAQYLESLGEMESAKNYYQSANDFLSIVRICCFLGDVNQAAQVANESGDRAACYHLARQYENEGNTSAAVHFFAKSHAYTSALRLAKENAMDDKIVQLSLMSSESDMIEAAKYYEAKQGQADKAVMLYHKAGMFGRAMDLALRTEQYGALDLIAHDLNENSDPRVLERCAEFFAQNQQYSQAVQLLAYAAKYDQAIDTCVRHNVPLTDHLVELLTPNKEQVPDTHARNKMLDDLANSCLAQGLYHFAAKKFTQSGSKLQAMRALLKSGDTEKILFFANTARSKEIYVMAGNYLQSVGWKDNPDLVKQIVLFYTKGHAHESLASFYDACAQVEIDDYRDYEKGASALQEALKCLKKCTEPATKDSVQHKSEEINGKLTLIKRFLNIRTIYEADSSEAMKQLQALAKEPQINESVRLGDIYAVLIIHNVKQKKYKKALMYLEDLQERMPRLVIENYVKPTVVDSIYSELNMANPNASSDAQDVDNEQVQESVVLQRQIQQIAG